MTMDHDRPEWRERIRGELLYPATNPDTGERIVYGLAARSLAGQARSLAENGLTVGDIATFQGVSLDRVRRMLGEAA